MGGMYYPLARDPWAKPGLELKLFRVSPRGEEE
jgi:hypothetical protein